MIRNMPAIIRVMCVTILCTEVGMVQGQDVNVTPNSNGFTLAFGSCSSQDMAQPLWPMIIESTPTVFAWLGDNIYADKFLFNGTFVPATTKVLADAYAKQLQKKGYQELLKQPIDVVGTWDDHDFGVNDGGADYTNKDESQQEFLKFIRVPVEDTVRWKRQGVYSHHVYDQGDGKSVLLVLLDTRYHRTPYSDTEAGDYLGAEQWRWLEDVLTTHANATLTIIASSLQILADDRAGSMVSLNNMEHWGYFPHARTKLFQLLETIPGAMIMISGDVHFAELNIARWGSSDKCFQRLLVDVTSSSMTHSGAEFMPVFDNDVTRVVVGSLLWWFGSWVSFFLPWRHRIQTYMDGNNFGLIRVNWTSGVVTASIHSQHEEVMMYAWTLEELAAPQTSSASSSSSTSSSSSSSSTSSASSPVTNEHRNSLQVQPRAEAWRVIIAVMLALLSAFSPLIVTVVLFIKLCRRLCYSHSTSKRKKN